MSKFLKVSISKNDEVLLAHLSLLPFDSFQENDNGTLDAYIADEEWTSFVQNEVNDVASMFDANVEVSELENKNWNEEWETNFTPVEVDDFVRIRADFHPSLPGFVYELTIHPKMAFGTGHHQTTYTMIKAMRTLEFEGKNVFDFGCGTGVLAIVASKMGAKAIDAVDIEDASFENTIENAKINECKNITTYLGDLSMVPVVKYDVILANINRNVLLADASDLVARLINPNGVLLLSGILEADFDAIHEQYTKLGLKLSKRFGKEGWLCLMFEN